MDMFSDYNDLEIFLKELALDNKFYRMIIFFGDVLMDFAR